MYTYIGQECTFLLHKGVHSYTSKAYTFIASDYQQITIFHLLYLIHSYSNK